MLLPSEVTDDRAVESHGIASGMDENCIHYCAKEMTRNQKRHLAFSVDRRFFRRIGKHDELDAEDID